MKFLFKDKKKKNFQLSIFRLPEDFILIGLSLGLIISAVLCTKFMRDFFLLSSSIYYILDPFLIQIITLLLICFFLYYFCKKNGKVLLGVATSLFCFLLILPVEYFLIEKIILKPSFSFNRPISEAEHALIAYSINNKNVFDDYIRKEIDSSDFKCISNQRIFSALKQLYEIKGEVSQQDIENIIRSKHGESVIIKIRAHFEKIREIWNRRIYMKSISGYIHVLKHTRDYKEGWFTRIFIGEPTELEELREYACPSGFAIRQVLILLTAIFLLLQGSFSNEYIVRPTFEKKGHKMLFLFVNVASFLYIILARVANYSHTFYDIGVGLLTGTFFFFLVLIILLRVSKLKLALVFLFSIPYFMFFSFYSQHAGKLLYLFITIWTVMLFYYLKVLVLRHK